MCTINYSFGYLWPLKVDQTICADRSRYPSNNLKLSSHSLIPLSTLMVQFVAYLDRFYCQFYNFSLGKLHRYSRSYFQNYVDALRGFWNNTDTIYQYYLLAESTKLMRLDISPGLVGVQWSWGWLVGDVGQKISSQQEMMSGFLFGMLHHTNFNEINDMMEMSLPVIDFLFNW